MVQLRGRLRLTLEIRDELGIIAQTLQHHLDSDLPVKTLVLRTVNAAHSARTQQLEQQEWPETGRNRKFMVARRTLDNRKGFKSLHIQQFATVRTVRRPHRFSYDVRLVYRFHCCLLFSMHITEATKSTIILLRIPNKVKEGHRNTASQE